MCVGDGFIGAHGDFLAVEFLWELVAGGFLPLPLWSMVCHVGTPSDRLYRYIILTQISSSGGPAMTKPTTYLPRWPQLAMHKMSLRLSIMVRWG